MKSGIYIIYCLTNGKAYIGQAKDLEKRKATHLSHLRTGNHPCMELQHDFNEYGECDFKFDVLEECEEEKLNHLEDYYILKYNAIDNGYNSKRGNVLSLDASDFGNDKTDDTRFKEFCEGFNNTTDWVFSLQVYVKLLNIVGNFDKTWKDYIDYIIDDNTDIYVYKNTLNGLVTEKVSKDNINKVYDKYMIYIKNYRYNSEFEAFLDAMAKDTVRIFDYFMGDLHDFNKDKTFKQLIEEYDIYNKTLPLMSDIISDKYAIDKAKDIPLYGDNYCTLFNLTTKCTRYFNKTCRSQMSGIIDNILLAIYFYNVEDDEDEYSIIEEKYNEYLDARGLKMYIETII